MVRGRARRLFYCPGIDAWDRWEYALRRFAAEMDIALLGEKGAEVGLMRAVAPSGGD